MFRIVGLMLLAVLSACGGGERWIEGRFAGNEGDVQIDGHAYHVAWVTNSKREFDFRAFRNEPLVILPDPLLEKQRTLAAAGQMAQRLCNGRADLVSETKSGDMQMARFRCG